MIEISKTGWWLIGGAGLALVGSAVVFSLVKKRKDSESSIPNVDEPSIGGGLEVSSSSASTKEEPNWMRPFDMNYLKDVQKWVAPRTIQVLSKANALAYARLIKNAKGRFNDDEAVVKSIFGKKLKDKTQVASLSEAFYKLYKKDMWQYLNSFLSQSELKLYVTNYVRKMPKYRS